MENPFDLLSAKLDQVILINGKLLSLMEDPQVERKIPFKDFLKEYNISRPTGYAWNERGLIKIVKIGGRNFVMKNSVTIDAKRYQRESHVR